MNTFEYINDMRNTLQKELDDHKKNNEEFQMISMEQHFNHMMNMLSILEQEFQMAEYNYEVQAIDQEIKTFDELLVMQKQLSDDVIIFQPIAIGEAEIAAVDMQSLTDVLKKMRDNDLIKENIIVLPPNINVFRAKLAKPIEEESDEKL